MFRDKQRLWRWHATKAGRIIACSGEGYARRVTCRRTLARFTASLSNGLVDFHNLFRDTKEES